MSTKDAITCHVLDTLTGRPAPGIKVTLQFDTTQLRGSLRSEPIYSYEATTNADGRIANWTNPSKLLPLASVVENCKEAELQTIWTLNFDTGSYYGEGNTFWPEVQLKFWVKPGEHYHVPLLLGPYSYTTYRGS